MSLTTKLIARIGLMQNSFARSLACFAFSASPAFPALPPRLPSYLLLLLSSSVFCLGQALPGLPKIRDIAGPLPVAPPPPETISSSTWVLITVATLTLAAVLFLLLSRRKPKPVPPAPLLAARARLREAAAFVPEDPHNELTTRLTTLLRLYVGETYQESVISTTTAELPTTLAAVSALPQVLSARIVAFVQTCDRSKYLPKILPPDAGERSALHNEARELLEELALIQAGFSPLTLPTVPPPLPPPAPPPLPPSLPSTPGPLLSSNP